MQQNDFFASGPTQSAEEAHELLKHYRTELILKGRALARKICYEEGTCHTRRIYDEMKDDIRRAGVGSYWLGCVFTKKDFEWTGRWHRVPAHIPTNHHGGEGIRIWRLRSDNTTEPGSGG